MFSNSRYKAFQKHHGITKRRYLVLFIVRMTLYISKILGVSKWLENYYKKQKKTDVLFVFPEPTSEKRLGYIAGILRKNNISTKSVQLNELGVQLTSLLLSVDINTPLLLLGATCNARYFVLKYRPKVIVISINSGVLPGILRYEINKYGGKLINIAHGTGFSGIAHTSSDFDYWLVFGQSTIDGKMSNNKRIGKTEAIIVGSPFLFGDQNKIEIHKEKVSNSILIASQWVPNRGNYPVATKENREIMLDFIQRRSDLDFFVKLHHMEKDDFWSNLESKYQNLNVYNRDVTLLHALKKANLCLHMSSNASIEAGLMGVPSITIDTGGHSSHLQVDRFLPVVTTINEFNHAFEKIMGNYDAYQKNARAYAKYMFGGFFCGAGLRISEHIATVMKTGKIKGTQLIPDTDFLLDKT